MPTRAQVCTALVEDGDYGRVGRTWGIPAGRVYLIATGRPADGSGGQDSRAQALVNPP
jgi:monoamine oxidase